MLHFINDEHQVCFRLVDQFREGLCKADAALLAYIGELEATFEARRVRLKTGNQFQFQFQFLEHPRTGGLQRIQGLADGAIDRRK